MTARFNKCSGTQVAQLQAESDSNPSLKPSLGPPSNACYPTAVEEWAKTDTKKAPEKQGL